MNGREIAEPTAQAVMAKAYPSCKRCYGTGKVGVRTDPKTGDRTTLVCGCGLRERPDSWRRSRR